MRVALIAIAMFVAVGSTLADTLTTPSYKIDIAVQCPEGNVTCDHVRFTAVNRNSGKSVTLIGKTVHSLGADGVTPSHFLGYEFMRGRTKYFVSEDGVLQITRGWKVLIEETGAWKY